MDDWANLPGDILAEIEKHLIYVDYIRFCAVCLQWRCLIPKRPKLPVSQIPWLMLPHNEESDSSGCSIYNLVDKKVYPLELPEASGMMYCGSSYGWLVVVENGLALKIVNPLMRKQVDLPPVSALPSIEYLPDRSGEEYRVLSPEGSPNSYYLSRNHVHNNFIYRVVLSPCHMSRLKNEYTVAIIYGEFSRLAFCKHGDTRWTAALENYFINDALFHEGRFYGITDLGLLVGSSPDMLPKIFDMKVKFPKNIIGEYTLYLVGIAGGLLMVVRRYRWWDVDIPGLGVCSCYRTRQFSIYKLDMSTPRKRSKLRWFKIKSLDKDIMFVGFNSSFLVSTQDIPGLQGNCIYFTDDMINHHHEGFVGGYDVGVFDLEDGSIKKLPGYAGADDSLLIWPPPTWVTPCSC